MIAEAVRGVDILRETGGKIALKGIEVGAANGDVIGSGRKRIHGKTLRSLLFGIVVVAAGRPAVATGHSERNALCCGLLPQGVDVLIAGRSLIRLAPAEADVENIRLVVVNRPCNRKKQAGIKVGIGGSVKNHIRIRSNSTGYLRV